MELAQSIPHKGGLVGVHSKVGNHEKAFQKHTADFKGGGWRASSFCDLWEVEFESVAGAAGVEGTRALWDSCKRTFRDDTGNSVFILALHRLM